jgi:hypothetical protein
MPVVGPTTVNVDCTARGAWEVELPDSPEHVKCETLDDAKRVAYLCAAHRHPCELIVRDAYHRVLHREFIDGDGDLTDSLRHGREPLSFMRRHRFGARRRA